MIPARRILREHFHVEHLEALGLADYETGAIAAGAVLQYLYETQKNTLEHLTRLTVYTTGQFMCMDTSTRRKPGLTRRSGKSRSEAHFSGCLIRRNGVGAVCCGH